MARRISITQMKAVDGFWQGRVLIEGAEAHLTSEMDAALYDDAAARSSFLHAVNLVVEHGPAIRDAVAVALVDAYNTQWRQGRTPKLTRAAFAKKLSFEEIHTSEPDQPSRLVTVLLGGAEMFGRHRIGCMLGWSGTPLIVPTIVH